LATVLIPEICLANAIDPSDVKNYPDGTLAQGDGGLSIAVRSYPCLALECWAAECDACQDMNSAVEGLAS